MALDGGGCPHYGLCGGCSLRHLSYNEQLALKRRLLAEAFIRAGIPHLPEIALTPSPPDGYRDRAQFHRVPPPRVTGGRRTLLPRAAPAAGAGFMAARSNTVIPLDDCLVLNDTLRAALKRGELRPPLDKDRFHVYGRNGLVLIEGSAARGRVSLEAGGAPETLMIDAGLFFQNNSTMLERLCTRLLAAAAEAGGCRAADFYAGVGTMSVFLRRIFPRIDLLEANRAALALARENLCAGGGSYDGAFRFFGVTDSDWVTRHGARRRYDFICADPGRQGLSPLMRRWLSAQTNVRVAYISCEVSALARDARALTEGGFRLLSLEIFDFYPQTPRVETLALFART